MRLRLAITATMLGAGLLATAAPAAAASVTCDKVASPNGSDSAAGTLPSPYKTLQKLANSLSPGETGCLRAGTYDETNVRISTGGTASARMTLRSYPGERATHVGRIWVANTANYVTIASLNLDGSGGPSCNTADPDCVLPSPTVNGNHGIFVDNDVTNRHTAICFNLGSEAYGRAVGTVIERNRIHNCGRLPATNHHHGIYVQATDDVVIRDNWIYDNADRGVQLYPDAQRTVITGNVIDGNGSGVIFGSTTTRAPDDNTVEGNIISNSILRWNVESSGTLQAVGNVARDNCVFGANPNSYYNSNGGVQTPARNFTASNNLISKPGFVDRAGGDFRLEFGDACLTKYTGMMSQPDPPSDAPPGDGHAGPRPPGKDPSPRPVRTVLGYLGSPQAR